MKRGKEEEEDDVWLCIVLPCVAFERLIEGGGREARAPRLRWQSGLKCDK